MPESLLQAVVFLESNDERTFAATRLNSLQSMPEERRSTCLNISTTESWPPFLRPALLAAAPGRERGSSLQPRAF